MRITMVPLRGAVLLLFSTLRDNSAMRAPLALKCYSESMTRYPEN